MQDRTPKFYVKSYIGLLKLNMAKQTLLQFLLFISQWGSTRSAAQPEDTSYAAASTPTYPRLTHQLRMHTMEKTNIIKYYYFLIVIFSILVLSLYTIYFWHWSVRMKNSSLWHIMQGALKEKLRMQLWLEIHSLVDVVGMVKFRGWVWFGQMRGRSPLPCPSSVEHSLWLLSELSHCCG